MGKALNDYYRTCARPKPEKRRTTKARKVRAEASVKRTIRARCVERDGYCRYAGCCRYALSDCAGPSEWAHLGTQKRARTRGQAPAVRHTTAGSVMLCQRHHVLYDAGKLQIEPETDMGADGPLRFAPTVIGVIV